MKKIIIILVFISTYKAVTAQYIIAGQYTTNDYYHDVVPDSSFYAVGNSQPFTITKALDVNGDGILDFNLVIDKGGGLGNPYRAIYLHPLNNNEIYLKDTAACAYTNGSPICCGTITTMQARPFLAGDSIKSKGKWYKNHQYAAHYNYCTTGYFSYSTDNYFGVRVFKSTDTLYGWINIRMTSGPGCTLKEYACQRKCNSLPSINSTTSSTLICSGETSTLTANGASTYTWSTGANGASIVVSPTITTTYTVNGTYSNGCTNSSTITQNVDACIGIKEHNVSSTIKIYPNPTKDKIEFILSNSSTDIKIKILNSLGQAVLEDKRTNSNKFTLDVSNYTNGIYFVEVESNQGISRAKFVKN